MGNIQNGAMLTRRDREEMIFYKQKVIFIFFAYKKYSRLFIKFRLNHWWQMDFPGDAFHSFLNIDSVISLVVNGTVTSLPVFKWNVLNCVTGKWIMTMFVLSVFIHPCTKKRRRAQFSIHAELTQLSVSVAEPGCFHRDVSREGPVTSLGWHINIHYFNIKMWLTIKY